MPKKSIAHIPAISLNRLVLLILLFFSFCFKAKAQNVVVEAQLDKVSIAIGDQTLLHVSVRMPLKTEVTFPQLADSIGKVQIVKALKPDTTIDKAHPNFETISHSYLITAFDAGVYELPAFTFHTKTGDFKTGTVTLQVKAVPVDTTKTFYDIKQPLTVSYTFWDWLKDHWKAVLITLAVLLAIAGLIYYYKKRPVKEASVMAEAPALSLDTIILNKLNNLRAKNLWQQGQVKLYYSELSDVLREYLEKRYAVKAHEQTTDEILVGLQEKEIPQESKSLLKQVLTLADLVKFAKENPAAFQNEQSMENAISFIVQTKHQPQPTNDKEEMPK